MQICVISKNKDFFDLLSQYSDVDDKYSFVQCSDYVSYMEGDANDSDLLIIGRDISDNIKSEDVNKKYISIGSDITLPYKLDELFNFIKVASAQNKYEISGFTFDSKESTLVKGGCKINLTEKESQIVLLLIESSPDSIEKQKLLEKVFGYSDSVNTHTLETHIYRLRKKIGIDEEFIVTDKGGYKIMVN